MPFCTGFPRVQEMILEIQSDPFPLGYGIFFNKWFGIFLENISPGLLRVPFFIVKHIRLNIGPAFQPLVSPSVGQSEFAILFSTVSGFRACFYGGLFHVDIFMAWFNFLTMLWNKCGLIFIEKNIHFSPKRNNLTFGQY